MSKQTVTVRIRGQDFQVVTDGDEGDLVRVAGYLDETMKSVEQRTGTVDSLDVALLTGLNLAREIVDLREGGATGGAGFDDQRLQALCELVESAVEAPAS